MALLEELLRLIGDLIDATVAIKEILEVIE